MVWMSIDEITSAVHDIEVFHRDSIYRMCILELSHVKDRTVEMNR